MAWLVGTNCWLGGWNFEGSSQSPSESLRCLFFRANSNGRALNMPASSSITAPLVRPRLRRLCVWRGNRGLKVDRRRAEKRIGLFQPVLAEVANTRSDQSPVDLRHRSRAGRPEAKGPRSADQHMRISIRGVVVKRPCSNELRVRRGDPANEYLLRELSDAERSLSPAIASSRACRGVVRCDEPGVDCA